MAAGAPAMSQVGQATVDAARGAISADALGELCEQMTAIASPTGEERALAEFLVDRLANAGLEARLSTFGENGASVVATLRGTGDGPSVWVYAPLDTAWSGNLDEDRPWLGDEPRADFALPPRRENGKVIGLGAENPKGFAAAGIAAFEALSRAGYRPLGDLSLVLAGGSMPVNGRPGLNGQVGHGEGIRRLIAEERKPDAAIVLKPGWSVLHEEVGLAWFRITVRGNVNYTGIRHKGPYLNPIIATAQLVTLLEAWFAEFSAANTAGLVAPQGSINAIRSGSEDRASFVPSWAQIDLDLRVAPDASPDAVEEQLRGRLEAAKSEIPGLQLDLERTAALAGTRTEPDHWIVRTLIETWEEFEGKPHEPLGKGSGASDAAILRSSGIPAARIGLAPPPTPSPFSGFSMGVADEQSMARLATLLVNALAKIGTRGN